MRVRADAIVRILLYSFHRAYSIREIGRGCRAERDRRKRKRIKGGRETATGKHRIQICIRSCSWHQLGVYRVGVHRLGVHRPDFIAPTVFTTRSRL